VDILLSVMKPMDSCGILLSLAQIVRAIMVIL
jgi:hypothetical protein